MLPTFVIGLREGLEAALIVSIIATFLRKNGARLTGMWVGVGAGVLLSIVVGVVLDVVEQNLPQAEQEGLETVIGLVAVCFVTWMILWMRTHARFLKRDLEESASAALASGTTTALVVMAFLAVLREGFETAVFLLATFQGASSSPAAVTGAVLGIVIAVGLGCGIYRGGVRLNLQRFFNVTGLFLILVAAGLVLNAFRTAHEAGWVSIGQQRTIDLAWLAPTGSVRAALVSGVLGIPADPRTVEVLAWLVYLVPMLSLALWPAARRPGPTLARRLRLGGVGVALAAAAALWVLVPLPTAHVPVTAPMTGGGSATVAVHGGSATLKAAGRTLLLRRTGPDTWTARGLGGDLPATLDASQLLTYNGGRAPVGLDVRAAPGPYDATWRDGSRLTVTTYDGGLVDARVEGRLVLSLTGGGLTSPRVIGVDAPVHGLRPSYVAGAQRSIADAASARRDRVLWKHWVPGFLVLVAAGLLVSLRRRTPSASRPSPDPRVPASKNPLVKGSTPHAHSQA